LAPIYACFVAFTSERNNDTKFEALHECIEDFAKGWNAMHHAERQHFAAQAGSQVRDLLGAGTVGAFYTDALEHKISTILSAIDQAAAASEVPVLIREALPGFDLLVAKPRGARIELDVPPVDVKALGKLDPNTGTLLSKVVAGKIAQVMSYQGRDGLHYFAFRAEDRDKALSALGVIPEAMVEIQPAGDAQ